MSLSNYSITCLTEGLRILSAYSYTVPTTCPHNTNHVIDPSQTTVFNTITAKQVAIEHGDPAIATDNFMALGFPFQAITAGPNVNTTISYTILFNVLPRLITFMPNNNNVGDYFSIYADPNTTIGTITANANLGDTSVVVSNTAILVVYQGYLITITDGVNTNICGQCLTVNTTNNTITFQTALTHNFSAGAYIQITVPRVISLPIANTNNFLIGINNLRSTVVPPGTVIVMIYTNTSNTTKTFSFVMEYAY